MSKGIYVLPLEILFAKIEQQTERLETVHLLTLNSAEETASLARKIAPHLVGGDVLLLSGEIGAGKTHFARALILACLEPLGLSEDIPSPTFTLVQVYVAGPREIWHVDLYRLCAVGEVEELGLLETFDSAICLVEWPGALGDQRPARRLELEFLTDADDENRRYLRVNPVGRWDWLGDIMEFNDV